MHLLLIKTFIFALFKCVKFMLFIGQPARVSKV